MLRPGMTVLSYSHAYRRKVTARLEGRNQCHRDVWIASWWDERRRKHTTLVHPNNVLAVLTEDGFQTVLPGIM